jgi:hypothetical protein
VPSPTRNFATSSIGFCVADKPMRCNGRWHSASSRSSVSARCAPRLLAATAWISSTITLRTLLSMSRPDNEPISTYSDSGVVTRICGGTLRIRLRSGCGVSPVRTAVRIGALGRPSCSSCSRMPSSGASRLIWISLESAFNGDTYTTRVSSGSMPPRATASCTSESIAARKAVSVLPEPVGAATSVCRPALICGHACACAAVGAGKVASNHAETAGWKSRRGIVEHPRSSGKDSSIIHRA